jgi:hypothetical protein
MRRRPLILLYLIAAGYIYLLIRQVGRGLGGAIAGIAVKPVMMHGILPGFAAAAQAGQAAPGRLAALMLAGPILALLVGYVLLWAVARGAGRAPAGLGVLLCAISYLALVLDPLYYAVIPLLRMGGEPETLAMITGVSPRMIAIPAMAVLGLNVMLVRKYLVPSIKAGQARRRL